MFSQINIKSLAVIIFTTLLPGCVSAEQKTKQNKYSQQDIAYVNGQFFNPSLGFENKTVIIREGIVIAHVDALSDNFPGKVVDLQGKWGIPGLIDMHTHSFGNFIPNAKNDAPGTQGVSQRVLKAGVTGFVDLFGDETALIDVRTRQRNGEFVGADIYASLTCFTAPKGHCSEYGITTRTVSTVEQAQKQMAELAKQKPDVI